MSDIKQTIEATLEKDLQIQVTDIGKDVVTLEVIITVTNSLPFDLSGRLLVTVIITLEVIITVTNNLPDKSNGKEFEKQTYKVYKNEKLRLDLSAKFYADVTWG